MAYEPKAEHRFSFGLWTVGNIGIDPFGEPVREVNLAAVDLRRQRALRRLAVELLQGVRDRRAGGH